MIKNNNGTEKKSKVISDKERKLVAFPRSWPCSCKQILLPTQRSSTSNINLFQEKMN